jgi:two-component system, LytTR family, response regulator
MMRVIVVDDEDLARESLVSLLTDLGEIDILAECNNGFDAIKKVQDLKPQLLFLDIKMPRLNGFEVLDLLGKEAPPTIFVTAFDDFAIRAFEANAIDYLLKPVNPGRLKKSLEKLAAYNEFNLDGVEKVIDTYQSSRKTERILVRDGDNVHIVPLPDVLWIEAQDDYIAIKTKDDVFLKLDRLGKYEKLLASQKFRRIHRSYLVNIDQIQRIENQNTAVLKSGHKLPVSRSGFNRFFK